MSDGYHFIEIKKMNQKEWSILLNFMLKRSLIFNSWHLIKPNYMIEKKN